MRFRLLVSEAWRSLGANLSTTFAATMTVLVGMFLLGLFIALGTWTLSWSDHVKRQLMVKVYFESDVTRAQETAVARLLQANPMVKSFAFVPKSEALDRMERRLPELTRNLTSNPLPDSFEVQPKKGEDVEAVYASLTTPMPAGVYKVSDGKRISKRILQVAHVIEAVFTVATLVLLVSATLLIANTIRLSIFSRRREIEVMKLVGATNWFVRGPFMVEGLLTGIAGSLLAVMFLLLGKEVALPSILRGSLTGDADVQALPFTITALILVAFGLLLGAIGSALTMRRFLRV
ncbi:MAG TPA: permease-like cell division protein FtsX [Gaiellaceae bacterium]|nr:permease-like cell division protein FtsX [Gaiellaceae bacterium]